MVLPIGVNREECRSFRRQNWFQGVDGARTTSNVVGPKLGLGRSFAQLVILGCSQGRLGWKGRKKGVLYYWLGAYHRDYQVVFQWWLVCHLEGIKRSHKLGLYVWFSLPKGYFKGCLNFFFWSSSVRALLKNRMMDSWSFYFDLPFSLGIWAFILFYYFISWDCIEVLYQSKVSCSLWVNL